MAEVATEARLSPVCKLGVDLSRMVSGTGRARSRWIVLLLGAFVMGSGSARAEPQHLIPVKLVYEAPGACPSRTHVVEQLLSFSRRVRVTDDPEETRVYDLRIVVQNARFEGGATSSDRDADLPRRVRGRRCEDVARSLALFVALAVDPDAGATHTNESTSTKLPAFPSEEGPSGAAPPPPAASPPPLALSLGSGAALLGGVMPALAPAPLVFVEAEFGRLWRWGGLGPSLRAWAAVASPQTRTSADGSFSLAWRAIGVVGCPLRRSVASGVDAAACLSLELGEHVAHGYNTAEARAPSGGWIASGLRVDVAWRVWGPLRFGLDIGMAAPWVRNRFFFQPNNEVFRPAFVGFRGGMDIGATFL